MYMGVWGWGGETTEWHEHLCANRGPGRHRARHFISIIFFTIVNDVNYSLSTMLGMSPASSHDVGAAVLPIRQVKRPRHGLLSNLPKVTDTAGRGRAGAQTHALIVQLLRKQPLSQTAWAPLEPTSRGCREE